MAGTGLYVNWAPVTVTPAGGSLITLTEITDVGVMSGSKIISFHGDARKFARGKKSVEHERHMSITTGNCAQSAGLVEGVVYSISATLQDMNNGVGSGAIVVALVNAVLKSNPFKGSNNQFANGTLEFEAYANAADDDPLTITVTA